MKWPHSPTVVLLLCILTLCGAATRATGAGPELREWTVDGVARQAMVYVPDSAAGTSSPLVFVFHGHGGRMRNSVRKYAFHEKWPEAIVICPQGLNTPGKLTDPEGKKPGWQKTPGDQDDRDLKFFDTMLSSMREENQVDENRIYVTGHSNGGGFTYLLLAVRGDVFAAAAPTATAANRAFAAQLKPKPVFHLAGKNDPLVKYNWQDATIQYLRKLNGTGEGQLWKEAPEVCTLYPSETGNDLVTYIHPGGHEFPGEAVPAILKFFLAHPKKP